VRSPKTPRKRFAVGRLCRARFNVSVGACHGTARSFSATWLGKLDVLNVECGKCGRRGRYHLHRMIERYGIDAKLFDCSDEITADCPRKQARNLSDQCGARCPDLSKVV
jgi:hypothetical protein